MQLSYCDFDSAVFGLRWYRLEVAADTSVAAVYQAIEQSDAQYVDTKLEPDLCHLERPLKQIGFRKTCVQIVLSARLDSRTQATRSTSLGETLIQESLDEKTAMAIAAVCSRAFRRDRFSLDECLPEGDVAALYARWIRNSLQNPSLARFVSGLSFCTVKWLTTDLATIDLIAVDPAEQGTGVGSRLLQDTLTLCRNRGCKVLHVTTETENPGAVRFYRRQGFQIDRFIPCLHLRRSDLRPFSG